MTLEQVGELLEDISDKDSSIDIKNIKGMTADDRFLLAFLLLYKDHEEERKFRKLLILALIAVVSGYMGFQAFGG